MNGIERDILAKCERLLTMKNVDDLLINLKQRKVFQETVSKEIETQILWILKSADNSKNESQLEIYRLIYDQVTRSGPAAFEHLIGALFDTENEDLAKYLLQLRYDRNDYLNIVIEDNQHFSDDQLDKDLHNPEDVYRINPETKGDVLIINIHDFESDNSIINEDFKSLEKPELRSETHRRFGSYRDVSNLYGLFSKLGFNVDFLYDVTEKRLIDELARYQKKDFSSSDSLFVILMSHGELIHESRVIETYDSKYVSVKTIRKMFDGNNCPGLLGKPKVFIVQACSGHEHDHGIPVDISTFGDSSALNDSNSTKYHGKDDDILIVYSSAEAYPVHQKEISPK